ncbi:MAG: hypothetical protein IIW52_06105, partial [Alistipes sp.]|nr:hypothetical protein [Alistipes sp.]
MVREKREIACQACLNKSISLFFIVIATVRGYPQFATAHKRNRVSPKVFGAAFFKKGQYYWQYSAVTW